MTWGGQYSVGANFLISVETSLCATHLAAHVNSKLGFVGKHLPEQLLFLTDVPMPTQQKVVSIAIINFISIPLSSVPITSTELINMNIIWDERFIFILFPGYIIIPRLLLSVDFL